ncbi:hypothetical protein K8I85_18015 [bacterium]|nr:hypothetical protein [bacterium]
MRRISIRKGAAPAMAAAVLALALGPVGAAATSYAPLPLSEAVARSSDIVHGRVTGTTSRWNADHSAIETEAVVEVIERVKGESSEEIRVVWPGGEVGALRMEAAGVSPLREKQEVVLLLESRPDGRKVVTGLSHGRFDVLVAPGGAEKSVRPGTVAYEGARAGESLLLAAFLDRLRRLDRREVPTGERTR